MTPKERRDRSILAAPWPTLRMLVRYVVLGQLQITGVEHLRAYGAVAVRLGQKLAPLSHSLATPGAHLVALIGH
jgi:hypothetical protein